MKKSFMVYLLALGLVFCVPSFAQDGLGLLGQNPLIEDINTYTEKIDSVATDGLSGIVNSLAYRVEEIEKHFHNREIWVGLASDANATHRASEIGKEGVAGFTETGFVVTSGNDDWSDAPTLVIGIAETEIFSGAFFNLHRIMAIATSDEKELYMIRISWGTTSAAQSITDGDYTTFPIYVLDTAKDIHADEIIMPRIATTGVNVWMYVFHPNENDKTITFYLGIHEYEG